MPTPWDHFVHRTHTNDFPGGAGDRRDYASAQKFTNRFTRTEKLTCEVDADDRVPLFQGHFVEGCVLLEPGIINQNVDGAVSVEHFREHRLHFIFPADISFYRDSRTAILRYLCDDTLGISGIEVTFEDELRGARGLKQVEVDALGRETNVLQVLEPVRSGANVVLVTGPPAMLLLIAWSIRYAIRGLAQEA